jgi:phage repressor protein C with HTH and peptisase S24 domain
MTQRKIDHERGARIKSVRTDILKLKSQEAFADALTRAGKQTTRGAVGNWELGKEVSIESLTAISKLAGVSLSWLAFNDEAQAEPSAESDQRVPKPNASFPPRHQRFDHDRYVPVMGQTSGGPNGRFILNGSEVARVFCPPGLENVRDAYAVRVFGTSMEPRFMAGETVWLNPQEPVRAGDDVVVQVLRTGDDQPVESYIKQYKSRSSGLVRLWQHNPEEGETHELEFPADAVFSIHKIVFHATT